ncbi:hypothetical protein FAUST_8696 [Fusarium austroamericanum]|uniref:Uncharacterized protein n=1 Tax=Fusarium austroamericanum TaxID=282268 RepID=A0AAN5Z5K5_FUSAU|nr:hypothetical protein FAUST_8696 [Fusarium austroamericanum]
MSLNGKVAIVTGGARRIGRGIVLTLAKQGAQVAFTYVSESSEAHAKALVREVESLGSSAHAIKADAASLSSPKTVIECTLSAFNVDKLDILFNNAGLESAGTRIEEVTASERLSLTRPGGRIVNLSSISARGGFATKGTYSASKAAVEALTRCWATELGHKYKVTVNAVNPGPVDTDMYRAAGETHFARMEEQNKKTPAAPRAGTENDVVEIIGFLCEERSRWITRDIIEGL